MICKKNINKLVVLFLVLAMTAVFAASCSSGKEDTGKATATAQTATPAPEKNYKDTEIKVAALKGPTGIGITKLMNDSEAGTTKGNYKISLAGSPDELTGKIVSGELDVAALPTNVAATLFNKSNGKVKLAALNTLGVLYILQKGDAIKSLSDLNGKTIYSTGQGTAAEYALDYILKSNKIDVKVEYMSEHSELAAAALAGRADLFMLPEPFVTTVTSKDSSFKIAVNITEEFEKACKTNGAEGTVLTMGCLVVNTAFAEKNKEALNNFLDEYKASALYATSNVKETAELVAKYEIMASAAAAEKAIPNCNIVYIDGTEMKNKVEGFFKVLYDYNPNSIGGAVPGDELYYTK